MVNFLCNIFNKLHVTLNKSQSLPILRELMENKKFIDFSFASRIFFYFSLFYHQNPKNKIFNNLKQSI
jgi:hypothetical protein